MVILGVAEDLVEEAERGALTGTLLTIGGEGRARWT